MTTILIVFLTVPLPLCIILYFVTRWKESREISTADEDKLEELWRLASRFEDRLESLEIILDEQGKSWRRDQDE